MPGRFSETVNLDSLDRNRILQDYALLSFQQKPCMILFRVLIKYTTQTKNHYVFI